MAYAQNPSTESITWEQMMCILTQVTSLVANEGLIVCGLCNGTANVYSQVRFPHVDSIKNGPTHPQFRQNIAAYKEVQGM